MGKGRERVGWRRWGYIWSRHRKRQWRKGGEMSERRGRMSYLRS